MFALHKVRGPLLLLGFVSILVIAGCESPSALAPVSGQAQRINDLIMLIFVVALIVFVVVEGLLLFAAIRFSRKRQAEQETEVSGRVETLMFAAPAIVLAVVFVISALLLRFLVLQTGPHFDASVSAGQPILKMRVVAHQWWWEFNYPDLGIITADEMHIPLNTLVQVDIDSADVVHSFWVPQFAGKIDAVPGQTNHTAFTVHQAGMYHGQCSEFCGVQHAQMFFYAIAEPQAMFDAWVKEQQAPAAAATGDAARGEQVFMQGACVGCHAISGTPAQGTLGPNLTHFASRANFAGASQPTTSENIARWLANPQKLKPGNLMPNLQLSQDQIQALVAYLESLK
jgi:cytochrome c oxidase subunit 2